MKSVDVGSAPTEGASSPTLARKTSPSSAARRWLLLLLGLAIIVIARENIPGDSLTSQFQTFVTIFLSIFIEAVPFLLAGSIVSGLIEYRSTKRRSTALCPASLSWPP